MKWLWRRPSRSVTVIPPPRHQLVLAQGAVDGLNRALAPFRARQHEGVAYLFGLTQGGSTIVLTAAAVEASTTPGSFDVSSLAMARIVRRATEYGLQVVGQAHTHPDQAFHSGGDEAGARIKYAGYASVVLPQYGEKLPSLEGAAFFMFEQGGGFVPLAAEAVVVVPGGAN